MEPLPGDTFARRLRQERERRGLSQADIARRIAEILGTNVDPSAVTRIEQQIRAVRLDEACAAAQALGLPLAYLLEEPQEAESQRELQQNLVDLAQAQRVWDKQRQEIQRLMSVVQTLINSAVPSLPAGDAPVTDPGA